MEHPDFGTICECDCHRDGCDVMHCFPCCRFCGEKYISADGVVDVARFGVIIMNMRLAAQDKDDWRKREPIPPFTKFVFPRIKGLQQWPTPPKDEKE